MKRAWALLVVLTGLLCPLAGWATPVQLGQAGDYALLATGSPWHGSTWLGQPIILGSEADIHGNVGASGQLALAAGAVIDGDATAGSLSQGPGSAITGAWTAANEAYWRALHADLQAASAQAAGLAGVDVGVVDGSRSWSSNGALTVLNLDSLALANGATLTLSGQAGDQFVINVAGDFHFGGGAAVVLDGVNAADVLFNVMGSGFNVAAGSLLGTYIAPDAFMVLGDGLTLDGTRFLGAGIQGNLQTQHAWDPTPRDGIPVPEPTGWVWLLPGLLLLAARARRQRQPRH